MLKWPTHYALYLLTLHISAPFAGMCLCSTGQEMCGKNLEIVFSSATIEQMDGELSRVDARLPLAKSVRPAQCTFFRKHLRRPRKSLENPGPAGTSAAFVRMSRRLLWLKSPLR